MVDFDLKQVEALASRGLSYEQIAVNLGIDDSTLYRNRKKRPELQEAIKRGRMRGVSFIANKLYEAAAGGNTAAMIFFLKAQGGWREVQKIETVDATSESDVARALTTEELLEIARHEDEQQASEQGGGDS